MMQGRCWWSAIIGFVVCAALVACWLLIQADFRADPTRALRFSEIQTHRTRPPDCPILRWQPGSYSAESVLESPAPGRDGWVSFEVRNATDKVIAHAWATLLVGFWNEGYSLGQVSDRFELSVPLLPGWRGCRCVRIGSGSYAWELLWADDGRRGWAKAEAVVVDIEGTTLYSD